DEVHGVDDADDPDDGDDAGQNAEVDEGAGEGDEVEAKAEGDEDDGGGSLDGEFAWGVGAEDVVVDAETDDEGAGREDGAEGFDAIDVERRAFRFRGTDGEAAAVPSPNAYFARARCFLEECSEILSRFRIRVGFHSKSMTAVPASVAARRSGRSRVSNGALVTS